MNGRAARLMRDATRRESKPTEKVFLAGVKNVLFKGKLFQIKTKRVYNKGWMRVYRDLKVIFRRMTSEERRVFLRSITPKKEKKDGKKESNPRQSI